MIWITMITSGLLTFAMRFVMLSGAAPRKLPTAFKEALGFVPIAVLTAITVPAVLVGEDDGIIMLDNARLPAAIIAIVVALVSRSVVMTICAGLGTFWLLAFLSA
jgi:branched-subunit amino acid transport protein